MAVRYYGINRGQTEFQIVEGASTNSTDIELAVDLSKNIVKSDVIIKLQELLNYILKGNWPPA